MTVNKVTECLGMAKLDLYLQFLNQVKHGYLSINPVRYKERDHILRRTPLRLLNVRNDGSVSPIDSILHLHTFITKSWIYNADFNPFVYLLSLI